MNSFYIWLRKENVKNHNIFRYPYRVNYFSFLKKIKSFTMKQFSLFVISLLFFSITLHAQDTTTTNLPYAEIPDYPETYTAGSVAARLIDGLGFRYYWATEGLRDEDLQYKPSEKGRRCEETIDHIYDLSRVIVNATTKTINDPTIEQPEMNYAEKRKKTLENFKKASNILLKSNDLTDFKVVFKGKEKNTEFPFWNNINGPIADAIWHTGQVVLLRRASGNPFNSKVSVLTGKVRS